MLDLETLGRKPGCGITEIGWCCFATEEYKIYPAFGHLIPIEQSLLYGFDTEKETIRWWLEEQKGFPVLVNDRARITFPQILSDVASQWNELWFAGVQRLWSKPSLFDIPILIAAYEKLNVEKPIILRTENFWCWRDMMTITDIETLDGAFAESLTLTVHRAKADAEAQARRVSHILSLQRKIVQDGNHHMQVLGELNEAMEQNKRQAQLLRRYYEKRDNGNKRNRTKSRKR